jgi:hypothetical protein
MGLVLATTFGLILWIVIWASTGARAFDAFLVATLVIIIGAASKILAPYLPGRE